MFRSERKKINKMSKEKVKCPICGSNNAQYDGVEWSETEPGWFWHTWLCCNTLCPSLQPRFRGEYINYEKMKAEQKAQSFKIWKQEHRIEITEAGYDKSASATIQKIKHYSNDPDQPENSSSCHVVEIAAERMWNNESGTYRICGENVFGHYVTLHRDQIEALYRISRQET